MTTNGANDRIETGVRNLDALLEGGVPKGSAIIIAGTPGAGKTILTQQICFHHASRERRVLYISTLSEPTAKTLRYLNQFTFFDPDAIDARIQFVDLGSMVRTKGLAEASRLIMGQLKNVKPAIVVIDSFKMFDDFAESREDLRKFGYQLAVQHRREGWRKRPRAPLGAADQVRRDPACRGVAVWYSPGARAA